MAARAFVQARCFPGNDATFRDAALARLADLEEGPRDDVLALARGRLADLSLSYPEIDVSVSTALAGERITVYVFRDGDIR